MDETVGSALRAAREQTGLSIEDVSATTRIRGTVLRDIEADRFGTSGGVVYARGHVKSICAALGTSPERFLALFSSQAAPDEQSVPLLEPRRAPSEPMHVPTAERPERRGPNWSVAGAAALAIIVGLFVIGQVTKPDRPAAEVTSVASGPSPVVQPSPRKGLVASRPLPIGAELRLRLIGGASWVSVRNATRTLYEGVLPPGTVRDFRDARQLRLIVGNAGAVNLVCGGKDLGAAGGVGAVKRFTCNASGIVAG
ncbi:MAG: rane protein [Frankiales bacterium]|nr:rane protein [Frankiales bacterium]